MTERDVHAAIVRAGQRLAQRGLAPGTSGNISVALDAGHLMTPTGRGLGELAPDQLAVLGATGDPLGGERPTKERPLHLAVYAARPETRAIVHLHSTFAVALSCLSGLDDDDALPPITPYQVMRLGRIRTVGYAPPGSDELAQLMRSRAASGVAFLLANHGPLVLGDTLEEAVAAAEELEEAARVYLLIADRGHRRLSDDQVAVLVARFRRP